MNKPIEEIVQGTDLREILEKSIDSCVKSKNESVPVQYQKVVPNFYQLTKQSKPKITDFYDTFDTLNTYIKAGKSVIRVAGYIELIVENIEYIINQVSRIQLEKENNLLKSNIRTYVPIESELVNSRSEKDKFDIGDRVITRFNGENSDEKVELDDGKYFYYRIRDRAFPFGRMGYIHSFNTTLKRSIRIVFDDPPESPDDRRRAENRSIIKYFKENIPEYSPDEAIVIEPTTKNRIAFVKLYDDLIKILKNKIERS